MAVENSGTGPSHPTAGVANGVAYSLGPQGALVVGGLTIQTSSPTTATLKDGQVVIVGPNGDVAVQGLPTGSGYPIIGTADGIKYSIGPGGVAVIEGHTFQTSSPTTATLNDGHVVIVGPTGGIAIENGNSTPTPTTGMIDGVPYTVKTDGMVVIDGHTFNPSSPMTTTLSDGYVVMVDATGAIAVVSPASTNPPTPTTGMADGVPYTIEPDGALVIEGHTFRTSSPTTTTFSDGHVLTIDPTGNVSLQDHTAPVGLSQNLSVRDYIIGAFIPTLIAVIFCIPWHILSSAIKEMEPFFQLQRADGAPAESSICLGYKASITPISTLNAIRNGHFLVWSSGLVSLIILLIPPLSSETVFIGFTNISECTITFTTRKNCYPVLSVYPLAARVIEGILAFVAVMTLAILITLSYKNTGVYTDPTSIAGLASLFQDQRAIGDFRRINACWPDGRQLKNALRGSRYRIGEYTDVDGTPSYGLMCVHTTTQSNETAYQGTLSMQNKKYTSVAVTEVEEPLPTPTKRQSTISAICTHSTTLAIFVSMITALLAIIIYYYKNGSRNPFEAFMDSQSFGTSFLFTAIGVLIKIYMTYLDNGKPPSPPPNSHPLLTTLPPQTSVSTTPTAKCPPPPPLPAPASSAHPPQTPSPASSTPSRTPTRSPPTSPSPPSSANPSSSPSQPSPSNAPPPSSNSSSRPGSPSPSSACSSSDSVAFSIRGGCGAGERVRI